MKLFAIALFICSSAFSQHIGVSTLEEKPLPPLPSRIKYIDHELDSLSASNGLSAEQKNWFYWVNYSRDNPRRFWDSIVTPILLVYPTLKTSNSASLQRDLYSSHFLMHLMPNQILMKTAQYQAKDLSERRNIISHNSSNGSTFQQRMVGANIKKCAGENIGIGNNNPVLMLVLLYIDEGVAGTGHRKSLLNPDFEEMGIGISSNNSNGGIVMVQDFACKQ